ncbi:hypothetical protein BGZ72_008214 [Mortierella alpina]|nr:hypothetical protein BGZ72_008214 [Mortierella alpina]
MLLIKSLLALCTATVILASDNFDALSSVGYFSGDDLSDHAATGLPVFSDRRNHAKAVASIVQYWADFTNFRPAQQGVIADPGFYSYFIVMLENNSALKKTASEVAQIDLIGTKKQLVGEIEYYFENLDKEIDYPFDPKIAKNFGKLVPKTLKGPDQKHWLLNQVAIYKAHSADEYRIEVARVKLRMSENTKTGKAEIAEQRAIFLRDVFTVDTDWLIEHAEDLAKGIETVNVEEAVAFLTTKAPRRDEVFNQQVSFCEEPEKKQYEFFGRSRFILQ